MQARIISHSLACLFVNERGNNISNAQLINLINSSIVAVCPYYDA
jgi:hypothetical protein